MRGVFLPSLLPWRSLALPLTRSNRSAALEQPIGCATWRKAALRKGGSFCSTRPCRATRKRNLLRPACIAAGSARHWYQAAASQGHLAALESLRFLASEGNSAAFYAFGVLSRDGLGVARDPVAARQAFHWAAEGGHIVAHFALAEMLASGQGGVVDALAAIEGYRQAARLAVRLWQRRPARKPHRNRAKSVPWRNIGLADYSYPATAALCKTRRRRRSGLKVQRIGVWLRRSMSWAACSFRVSA